MPNLTLHRTASSRCLVPGGERARSANGRTGGQGMRTHETRGLDVPGTMPRSHTLARAALVGISILIGGCVTGSPPGTGAGPTQGGDLVYNVCLDVHAGSVGAQMLPIVCRTIADSCKQDPGGDGCKGPLRALDEKMK